MNVEVHMTATIAEVNLLRIALIHYIEEMEQDDHDAANLHAAQMLAARL